MALLFAFLGLLLAAFVKGCFGFGFPTIATPAVALLTDVRTAIVILVLPNIVLDFLQVARRPLEVPALLRRHSVLYLFGVAGTFVGTKLLVTLPPRVAVLTLGLLVLTFVGMSALEVMPRIPPGWERPLAPPLGFASGVLGGLTNVPGLLLIIYFYSLGLPKGEFVRSNALSFLVFKLAQLAAVWQFQLLTGRLFLLSLLAGGLGLGAFRAGVWVQDRADPARFNRWILAVLAGMGLLTVLRGLR